MAAEGIEVRHAKACRTHTGERCNCKPSYRAGVYSKRDGRKVYSGWVKREAEAKTWRADALVKSSKGQLRTPSPMTVRQAADEFMAAVRDRKIVSDRGEPYRASTIRNFEIALRAMLPRFGDYRLSDLRHTDVQAWADEQTAAGAARGPVLNALKPLAAIYRRAVKRGEIAVNPVLGVTGGRRSDYESRYATPVEAAQLLAALPRTIDRAAWGVMFYGGLRRGEMLALRWDDVDFRGGNIRVGRSWDADNRVFNQTKSGKARTVPLLAELRPILLDHAMDETKAGRGECLLFSRLAWAAGAYAGNVDDPAATPATPNALADAYAAWDDAGLQRINPHACRHTFAALAIAAMGAAGKFNPKMIQHAMGHSSIAMTYDRYGKLFPGADAELGKMMDDYLEAQAAEALRLQQLDLGDTGQD